MSPCPASQLYQAHAPEMSSSHTLLAALSSWLDDPAASEDTACAELVRAKLTEAQRKLESVVATHCGKRKRLGCSSEAASVSPSSSGGRGELVLIGSGLKAMCHLTREAMCHLRAADVVFGALQPASPDRKWLELAKDFRLTGLEGATSEQRMLHDLRVHQAIRRSMDAKRDVN